MDDNDDLLIFPLTDIESSNSYNSNISNDLPIKRMQLSLRERRRSKASLTNLNVQFVNTIASSHSLDSKDISTSAKLRWRLAFRKLKYMKDPWADFKIHKYETEICRRHRYRALTKKWVQDEIYVKMERNSFDHGALRECFRLKKKSTSNTHFDWKHAHNYVAKRYMDDVDREVYFDDVRLQMDAKLWGEEYDRHKPPKKVDIMQMFIIEFIERPGNPLYHLEHFIEGNYVKYNSNSGFVDEHLRSTPQSFSHFTFERSGHKLIVVDIQGVGDLWTDPQIHTYDGIGYGDGNLGAKGMALFFHSHNCNSICESFGLSKFDLAPSELEIQQKFINVHKYASTCLKNNLEHVISPSPTDCMDLTAFLARSQKSRSISTGSDSLLESSSPISDFQYDNSSTDDLSCESPPIVSSGFSINWSKRRRGISESSESNSSIIEDEERLRFQLATNKQKRPSCFTLEMNIRTNRNAKSIDDSILGQCYLWQTSVLGQIHHEMAKYHEVGRFLMDINDEPDLQAALFHEQHAAQLGVMEAILTLANLHLGMPHDVLVKLDLESTDEVIAKGVDYMLEAAEAGDRSAMLFMARAFEMGENLGPNYCRSHKNALHWYQLAIERTEEDESGAYDSTMDNPLYSLKGKVADLYFSGLYDLESDPQIAGELYTEAADLAMTAMKGRIANKYYALAEEAWSQITEE